MQDQISQPQNGSWIELDKSALSNNIRTYKSLLNANSLLGCVFKGNAYGHGFAQLVPLFYKNPIDVIFLVNPHDGFYIRKFEQENVKPQMRIVIMGSILPDEMIECLKQNIEVSFGDEHFKTIDYFGVLNIYASTQTVSKKLKVHIHLDTGIGREGICVEKLDCILPNFQKNLHLIEVTGVMSHFANVSDVVEQEYAYQQIEVLNAGYEKIVSALNLTQKPEKHMAQSTAALILQQTQYDIVRIGVSTYGYWLSDEAYTAVKKMYKTVPKLQPVLSWKVRSQAVRELEPGSCIGYGCTYETKQKTRIALLPVGYYDGYPRLLSNIGYVLVNGKKCKILGRVMMNFTIVDVTEVTSDCSPIEATLIGQNGAETITADTLAKLTNTIQLEILTQIGQHLKRVVI